MCTIYVRRACRTSDITDCAERREQGPEVTWSLDQVMMGFMKTMLVSDFKATCIAVLKEVERTREPVVVTLRGRPMVRVEPLTGGAQGKRLGVLKGAMRIRRNLVRIETTKDWDMLK